MNRFNFLATAQVKKAQHLSNLRYKFQQEKLITSFTSKLIDYIVSKLFLKIKKYKYICPIKKLWIPDYNMTIPSCRSGQKGHTPALRRAGNGTLLIFSKRCAPS